MTTYDPEQAFPLTEYARLMKLTTKIVRIAAEAGKIPGAFRPYEGAHWRISGAALNELVKRMGSAGKAKPTKKQRKKNERAALAGLAAAV